MDKLLEAIIKKLLEQYLTKERIEDIEDVLKDWAIKALRDLAKQTDNKIDDAVVEMIAKAWDL